MVLGKTPYLKRSVELNRYTIVKDRSQQSNLFILGETTESRYAIDTDKGNNQFNK